MCTRTDSYSDQNWLSKLRNFGMTTEDEWKLTALREYIWRMARSKPRYYQMLKLESCLDTNFTRPSNIDSLNQLNNTFTLKDLDITPQTVFFDYSHNYLGMLEPVARDQIHSLADALIDASNTISDTNRRQNPRLIAKKIADKSSSRLQIPMGSANHSGASTPSTPRSATGVQVEGSYSSKISGPQSISNGDSSAGNGLLGPNKLAEGHRLRHKPSMISLLNKGKDSKAAAETATVSATATGTVEPPMSRAVSHEHMSIEVNDPGEYRFRTAYSYSGHTTSKVTLRR